MMILSEVVCFLADGRWPGRGKATEDPGGNVTSPGGSRPDGNSPEDNETNRLLVLDFSVATKHSLVTSSI